MASCTGSFATQEASNNRAFGDIKFWAVFKDLQLGQGALAVETYDGAVDDAAAVAFAEVDHETQWSPERRVPAPQYP